MLYDPSPKMLNRLFEAIKPWCSSKALYNYKVFESGRTIPGGHKEMRSSAKVLKERAVSQLRNIKFDDNKIESGIYADHVRHILNGILGNGSPDNLTVDVDAINCINAMPALLRKLQNPSGYGQVYFTVGLGGYYVLPSIRLASYLMPPLKSLVRIKTYCNEQGLDFSPRLQVFKANYIAANLNGYSISEVLETSNVTFRFLKEFVDKFFPFVSSQVEFEGDLNCTANPAIEDTVQYIIRYLHGREDLEPDKQQLVKMAKKHTDGIGVCESKLLDTALRYTAFHPIYNGSLLIKADNSACRSSLSNMSKDDIIFDFGGKPQIVFNRVGREIIDSRVVNAEYPTLVNIIHRACRNPGYYPLMTDGKLMQDVLIGQSFSQESDSMKKDSRYRIDREILKKSIDWGEFKSFASSFRV